MPLARPIFKNVKASFTLPISSKVKVKPIQFQGLIIAINTITSNVITLILMFMHLKSGKLLNTLRVL